MKKWILAFVTSFLSFSTFAADLHSNCAPAVSTTDPNFCASFKSASACRCAESGLPSGKCQDMNTLYLLMIARFGSVQKACEYQHDTTTQGCLDQWGCYRSGGRDSQGGLCSSTGNKCG